MTASLDILDKNHFQRQVLSGFRADRMLSFTKSLALASPSGIHSGIHGLRAFRGGYP